jgi:hypothetical protein
VLPIKSGARGVTEGGGRSQISLLIEGEDLSECERMAGADLFVTMAKELF